ncbi:hypothetical protein GGX14DRAFT_488629 [Mycena pura]|uniref:Uncharacterized protein n=1 Tax=Mycena pura TaxID=153505 RepID=A0AAD7E3U4_9AGAR|nr:hypothetical protein GGX14DRAFT_488629 [Mycena pura]
MQSPTIEPAPRPPSLRSVASNASIGASSLSRRPRTRGRSRTVSSSPQPDATSFPPPVSPRLPTSVSSQVLSGSLVSEPAEFAQPLDALSVHSEAAPESKARAQALKLSGIATGQYKPPPAAFSRMQFHDFSVRDSVLTHGSGFTQSGGSSSIYPPSTSTASGTESPPSPRSFAQQDEYNDITSYDPELEQEYGGDDVAYRLRLLVNNNYFLPPAHTKPSSSDFAASANAKKAAKLSQTPTFLDIFRRSRSKSRSKPSTPTGVAQNFDLTPLLRTTSDSTVVSAYAPQQPRGRTLLQALPHPSAVQDPSGRVVVVREKMVDIAAAVKQAEQEMKTRGAVLQDVTYSAVDVIDPTDAVDLPPPSATYPFAVQASALHEMGVQDSVGAALLADRLPPRSPGALSVDEEWRKALLRAAVDYSLNTSSDVLSSPHSKPTSSSSPLPSSSPGSMLGLRIVSPPLADEGPSSARSSCSHQNEAKDGDDVSRISCSLPLRVETPAMPLTPLAPPPRKLVNPLYSISQTSLPIDQDSPLAQNRPSESTPRLSDAYEAGVRHTMLSPPPIIRESSDGASHGESRISSESESFFFYSDAIEDITDPPRPSMSSSIPVNRASLSIYSQPSPTTSAFQDALNQPPVVNQPLPGSSLRGSLDQSVPVPRDSMTSPPPRVSSSLAHFTPLSPPPRLSSFRQPAAPSRQPPSLPTLEAASETPEIRDPGPSTPPFPSSEHHNTPSLVLEIPRKYIEPSIRSAPAPSSPPSFFDNIQSQPNAMDDLDSSDEDSYEDGLEPSQPAVYVDPHTHAVTNVTSSSNSSRSLLMRLGNHSTPYVSRSSDGHSDSKRAVGNVPVPSAFFRERRGGKSDRGHGPPTSTFDFYQYAKQHPLVSVSPSGTLEAAGPSRRPRTSERTAREQESLRRLDGMLIQHIETERDTIKRIATNLQSNART